MSGERILPMPDADSKPFWQGCYEHELRFQQCAACGEVRWPPSILCPGCHSQETRWIKASGRGTVYTFAVYHQAFHPSFKGRVPYVVAVVRLEEGPMLLTNIVGCPPEAVACDMPVQVAWDDLSEEYSLPQFRPLA
jgi:uncharacterized OB-fold protein